MLAIWNNIRKPIISAFILIYLMCVTLWLMAPSPRRNALVDLYQPVMLWSGLWQSFDVFAPNPRDVNLDLEAHITYSDGSKSIWKYPRIDQMGLIERTIHERWRKFGLDHLNWEKEKNLWPDFARFVAYQENSANRHPVTIVLVRHWAYIPKPEKGLGQPPPPHNSEYEFFTYTVKPEDLR